MVHSARVVLMCLGVLLALPVVAQDGPLSFATVERPPFATMTPDGPSGFSVELTRQIAAELGRDVSFEFYDTFPEMLSSVEEQLHDGAVANISITAERERVLDFSQPIFEGGVGVLVRTDAGGNPILSAILTRDFLLLILAALGLLFGSGMLMWVFERRVQPYFDRDGRDALFPAFWWALNLVVNGGFEERMPQSRLGRLFSVVLVIASLFVVSIFVATITAAITVDALEESVDSINDLEGRSVGTISASTSADLLTARDIAFVAFTSPTNMLEAIASKDLDAVVFDAPILSYYATSDSGVRLLDRIYRPENYGIALPPGSPLAERLDQTILTLREDGQYNELVLTWFGQSAD